MNNNNNNNNNQSDGGPNASTTNNNMIHNYNNTKQQQSTATSTSASSNNNNAMSPTAAVMSMVPIGGMSLLIYAICEILQTAYDYEIQFHDLIQTTFGPKFSLNNNNNNNNRFRSQPALPLPSTTTTSNSSTLLSTIYHQHLSFPILSSSYFYMVPILHTIYQSYVEEFLSEVSNQVHEDAWSIIATSKIYVIPSIWDVIGLVTSSKDGMNAHYTSRAEIVTDVSTSYLWMIAVINHFLGK
jgi:hypothetical protein